MRRPSAPPPAGRAVCRRRSCGAGRSRTVVRTRHGRGPRPRIVPKMPSCRRAPRPGSARPAPAPRAARRRPGTIQSRPGNSIHANAYPASDPTTTTSSVAGTVIRTVLKNARVDAVLSSSDAGSCRTSTARLSRCRPPSRRALVLGSRSDVNQQAEHRDQPEQRDHDEETTSAVRPPRRREVARGDLRYRSACQVDRSPARSVSLDRRMLNDHRRQHEQEEQHADRAARGRSRRTAERRSES